MKNGLRAWDADTHVNPAAEVLERYVDPSFRPRLPELAAHRHETVQIGGAPNTHQDPVGTETHPRVLAQANPHQTLTRPGTNVRGTKHARARAHERTGPNPIRDT